MHLSRAVCLCIINNRHEHDFAHGDAAGNFRDVAKQAPSTSATLSEQITVRQSPLEQSHTAGFDVSLFIINTMPYCDVMSNKVAVGIVQRLITRITNIPRS